MFHMKKIYVLIVLIFFTVQSYSQTFEYRYTGDEGCIFQVTENEFVYGIISTPLKEFYIFSLDHTLLKTIHLNDSLVQVIEYHLSKTLFNNDSKFELVYKWLSSSYHVSVVNEDGTILLSKDNAIWYKLYNTDEGAKMLISYYPSNYVDVYSLYGTILEKSEINSTSNSLPFPNPSNDYVNINYEIPRSERNLVLCIYNVNGQRVKEININSEEKYIKVNVSGWIPGVYNYKIYNNAFSTASKLFVVMK